MSVFVTKKYLLGSMLNHYKQIQWNGYCPPPRKVAVRQEIHEINVPDGISKIN